MLTKTFIVQNPAGIHARPANLFVKKASSFPCDVFLWKGSKKINGKSLLGVMALNAAHGDTITLEVDGEQETEALKELGDVLSMVYEE